MVLSGMNKMDDLIDNCNTYENFTPINQEEIDFLEKMALKLKEIRIVPCSECEYCLDSCPCNIPISEYFNLYNLSKIQPEYNNYRLYFDKLCDEKVAADECIKCESCIEYCTQKIDIPKELENLCKHFESGFSPYER